MTERLTRSALLAVGLLLGACGLYAFVSAVPTGEWLRVVIWLGGGVVAHDAILAPLAVVVGFVAFRQAPPPVRRWGRFGVLVLAAVVVVLVPLLATGGLRT
ncbi:MAG: hypothetical protein ABI243_10750 [Lapillicoccus sp.]